MELQTSGIFYNGENNSKSIKIIVEEGLRDKQIFLDFETADGKKWKSEQIELDENGEALFPLPSDVLTGEGVAYIQAIAASTEDNGFIEKSRLYKIKVRNSINAKTTIEYPVLEIVENGEYDVQRYKGVKVNVPDYAMDLIARTLTSYSNDKLNSIGDYAFYHNKTLANIELPNVTSIGTNAFRESGLTNADFPNVTSIGDYAFYQCSNLTNADFSSLKHTGTNTFQYNYSLTTVNMSQLKTVGSYAFSSCHSLQNINLPSVTYIDAYGFERSSFISIEFENVIKLNGYAFYACQTLNDIKLKSITEIYTSVFDSCYSLKEVLIEQTSTVCYLYSTNVFYQCYHILGTTNTTWNPDGLKDGYIYVPASLLSKYKVATNWSSFASQIIGHEDLNAGATLPDYTTDSFTTQTWYSDKELTTEISSVEQDGRYYCRLEV